MGIVYHILGFVWTVMAWRKRGNIGKLTIAREAYRCTKQAHLYWRFLGSKVLVEYTLDIHDTAPVVSMLQSTVQSNNS